MSLARIRIQGPIEAGPADREWSKPEPDLAIVSEGGADFSARHPYGHELLVAIEVADSSFRKDATRKREIYAAAGVPQYWVLDIESRRMLLHRHLSGGDYTEVGIPTERDVVPMLNVTVGALMA